jgi:hypothetical protein
MTTRAEFRASLRNVLTDKTQWRDTLLNTWIEDAISDYSHNFPRLQISQISCVSGQKSYSLSSYTIFAIHAVEYPTGQTPRRLLDPKSRSLSDFSGNPYYDTKSDFSTLYIGESPNLGETISIEYSTIHAIPSSDATVLSIPGQHFELARLYIIWKAMVQLELDENVSVDRKRDMMNALGLNALRAERAYRNRLQDLLVTYAQSGIAGVWKQDKRDRIY